MFDIYIDELMVKLSRSKNCELSLGFVDDLAAAGRNK